MYKKNQFSSSYFDEQGRLFFNFLPLHHFCIFLNLIAKIETGGFLYPILQVKIYERHPNWSVKSEMDFFLDFWRFLIYL